jgi:hypothetical protein
MLAVLSGAAAAAWAYVVVWDWRPMLPTGLITAALATFLWRPGGPARRREERLFPKIGDAD